MTTTLTDHDLGSLLGSEAHCEVVPSGETGKPPCTSPAAWRMCIRCPACKYKPTGNVCDYHRQAILHGDGICWCGCWFNLVWERPI